MWVRKIHWRRDRLPTPVLGFPRSSVNKESACSTGDLALIPGLGRSPGEGNGSPLQYSCLENPVDRGAWQGARVVYDLESKPPLIRIPDKDFFCLAIFFYISLSFVASFLCYCPVLHVLDFFVVDFFYSSFLPFL